MENLVHFTRLLRRAGLSVGPGSTIDAVRAAEAVGVERRDDLYWALHAVLVTGPEQREVFDRAFAAFWRDPLRMNEALSALLPSVQAPGSAPRQRPGQRRVSQTLERRSGSRITPPQSLDEVDVVMTWSDREVLRTRDFEQMTPEELTRARRSIASMKLELPARRTRRWRPNRRGGRVDLRATLRATLRSGHGIIPLKRREPTLRPPELVILCDISGSMERYARMLLHFIHALTNDVRRVHTVLFGTRITNVTRQLRYRDVDDALARVGKAATDWSGGTRIGASLEAFNRLWSRRLLGHGATVLLITDGLDRDGAHGIEREAARLRRSCRRLIWLNPLLRYEDFEPKAAGVRALLRHVDEFRPVHNLHSLEQLARALGEPG